MGAHQPQQSESQQLTVTSRDFRVHQNYNEQDISNDIAIIRLSSAVSLTSAIGVVDLATDDSNKYVGSTGRISGWGLTSGSGTTLASALRYVDVQIISNSECNSIFGIIRDTNICTSGAQGTGSCSGDSGGPLTVNGLQVGVVSFGVQGCEPGYPSGFTRTSSYVSWIQSNTL